MRTRSAHRALSHVDQLLTLGLLVLLGAELESVVDDEEDEGVVDVELYVLLLIEGLLKPPYVVSPWSPMPSRSRPNDSQAQ
ncbi:MAG TPA: hypothetical protein VFB50_22960 [Chloroflexota bacterium]|nr:hypothetical protein [Chloroflexota bacterium]